MHINFLLFIFARGWRGLTARRKQKHSHQNLHDSSRVCLCPNRSPHGNSGLLANSISLESCILQYGLGSCQGWQYVWGSIATHDCTAFGWLGGIQTGLTITRPSHIMLSIVASPGDSRPSRKTSCRVLQAWGLLCGQAHLCIPMCAESLHHITLVAERWNAMVATAGDQCMLVQAAEGPGARHLYNRQRYVAAAQIPQHCIVYILYAL